VLCDFSQVPKDYEVGLETIRDGFYFSILAKNPKLGGFRKLLEMLPKRASPGR
jgi:hypothetical protein